MHERGVVITGRVTGYRSGDMGSFCPVGLVVVRGKQVEVSTGSCSSEPPAIGSEFELLYDPTTQKVLPYHPGIPYYTWSFIYAGLAFLVLCMAWPNNSYMNSLRK